MSPALMNLPAFLTNGYVQNGLAYFCLVLTGLAAGSFLKILLPVKKNFSQRFNSICLFISLAVIIYTILIFYTKDLIPYFQFARRHEEAGFSKDSYLIFLIIIFLYSMLLSFFWKIVIPLSVLIFSLFIYGNYYLLNIMYGPQDKKKNISLYEDKITFDNKDIPISGGENLYFFVDYCTIPDSLPLPLRRSYYSVKKIAESSKDSESIEKEFLLTDNYKIPAFYNNRVFIFYIENILLKNKVELKKIKLPQESFYPALYSINISFKGGNAEFDFVKDL